MSAANARFSSASIMALPPYLTTITRTGEALQPGQRLDERAGLAEGDAEVPYPGRGAAAHDEYAEFSCT